MGEIFVPGVGNLKLKEDVPSDQELEFISDLVGDPDDEGDPTINLEGPTELEQAGVGQPEFQPMELEGPLGIVPPSIRRRVREGVEEEPGLMQFLMEVSPSLAGGFAGATAGAAVGGPLAPAGALAGGIAGSLGGETFAQELGIAPRSDLNLALAGAGPAIGAGVGKAFQGIRRGAGQGFLRAPFVRTARARNIMGRSIDELSSLGASILSKQQGLAGRTASELYDAVRRAGVKVDPNLLKGTRQALLKQVRDLSQARGLGRPAREARILLKDTADFLLGKNVGIDDIVRARRNAGIAITKLQDAKGKEEAASVARTIFKSLDQDLDRLAATPFKKGRAARLAKAAIKRAKLEFSMDTLEKNVARFTKTEGDDAIINFKGFQNWLNDITNPKHSAFDKNFTSSLKGELPAIKKRIAQLVELTDVGGPGGPGSLVLRGQAARAGRAVVGGALGFLGGGGSAVGAAIGGVTFAQGPEMMVGILTTKSGSRFLERAARLGQGSINRRSWMLAGEIALRSLGARNEPGDRGGLDVEAFEQRRQAAIEGEASPDQGVEEAPVEETPPPEPTGRRGRQREGSARRPRPRLPSDVSEGLQTSP